MTIISAKKKEKAVNRPSVMSSEARGQMMRTLPDWRLNDDKTRISSTWRFPDFAAAFAFMTDIASSCEALDHHPNWSNNYRTVCISLTTHDVGGLTILDEKLAVIISSAAGQYGGKLRQS